ncbi:serine/threonine protein kinase, partial [Corallococcus exiguus]|nr:serine/threonine protein kinase [Corallococcus exiguus]
MHSKDRDSGGLTYLGPDALNARPGNAVAEDGSEPTLPQVRTPVSPGGTLIQGAVTPQPLVPTSQGLVPGQVVAGRYRVEK